MRDAICKARITELETAATDAVHAWAAADTDGAHEARTMEALARVVAPLVLQRRILARSTGVPLFDDPLSDITRGIAETARSLAAQSQDAAAVLAEKDGDK